MPDGLAAALAAPGLPWLCLATVVGGLVYGFAGFGSALIFVPVAAAFVPPGWAVLLMALFGLGSILTVLPRAWRRAERAPTLAMLAAAIVALPLGIRLLANADAAAVRWVISLVVAVTLAALALGWRRSAPARLPARLAVGAASGVVGGATGLTGPIVILFHLSGPGGAELTRANTIVFLTLLGAALVPALAMQGLVAPPVLWLGALLTPLYMASTRLGQTFFVPAREALYRGVAQAIILLAVLVGLPVWD